MRNKKKRKKHKKFNLPKSGIHRTSPLREKVHEIIFEADTPMGFLFDVILLVSILLSVGLICLDSVKELDQFSKLFWKLEWFFTILFTIEYVLRLYCVRRPVKYATSFYGIIDLLSILPNYILIFFTGAPSFAIIRVMRLLRVFRVFKLIHLMGDAEELAGAIMKARGKVLVFFGFILMTVCIAGTLMYEIEKAENTFYNIPEAIYWAIVTMTTVGYGDLVPQTVLGKIVASFLILVGYSLIIVPTGFISAEFVAAKTQMTTRHCQSCAREGHDFDAEFCKFCGETL